MSALPARRSLLDATAPWIFVLLWSTGFLGTKLGLPSAEPFTFLSLRFVAAIALLGLIAAATRAAWPDRDGVKHSVVAGLMLHAVYLGGVFTAIHLGLPAGITALVVGLQPILTAVFSGLIGERVAPRGWLGLALGFAGVVLVVLDKLLRDQHHLISGGALVAAGLALLGTTAGTLYQKRFCGGVPLLTGTLVQYGATLPVVALVALLFESRRVAWTPEFLFALTWLTVVLSLGAVLLLLRLIRDGSASRVTGLFYLVPALTSLFSYFLFGETLGLLALGGAALVLVGVALVVAAPRPPAPAPEVP